MKRNVQDPSIFTVVSLAPPGSPPGITSRTLYAWSLRFAFILSLAGCTSAPEVKPERSTAYLVCDSYIIFDMCVQDLAGDGAVDMIYFSDSNEIFMYRDGMKDAVAEVMPFHRCAAPLDAEMQATTNRILDRENLSLSEQLGIIGQLLANYVAAKPEIDACNARFEDNPASGSAREEEFFMDDADWDDE